MKKIITIISIIIFSMGYLEAKENTAIILELDNDIIETVIHTLNDNIKQVQQTQNLRETLKLQQSAINFFICEKIRLYGEILDKHNALKYSNLLLKFNALLKAQQTISINDTGEIDVILKELTSAIKDLPQKDINSVAEKIAETLYFFEKDGKYLSLYNFFSTEFKSTNIYNPYSAISEDEIVYITVK